MSDTPKTCARIKDNGERCGQRLGPDFDLCLWHDPDRKEEREKVRKRAGSIGGRSRNGRALPPDETPGPLETLQDAVRWAAWAARAVATGDLDTSRGNTVAKLLKEFRAALEKSESREKLEEIRRRVEELTGRDVGANLEALP